MNELDDDIQNIAKPSIEKKPFWQSNSFRAAAFCQTVALPDAPVSFNLAVLGKLKSWDLVESYGHEDANNNAKFRSLLSDARAKAEANSLQFNAAYEADGWNNEDPVDGEFTDTELQSKFPRGLELKSILGTEAKIIFRKFPSEYPLHIVSREDGREQVLRIVDTARTIEEINSDSANTPDIIPRFEALRFADGKTGLLIDWVGGRRPETPEEKGLCVAAAEESLSKIIEYDRNYWSGNYVISNAKDDLSNPKVFYVDSDIPERIAKEGFKKVE